MSTPYEKVFTPFLSKVKDDYYANLNITDEEKIEDMILLMNDAIEHFEYPKFDLDSRNDTLQIFNDNLDNATINIITSLMKLQWIERQIYDIELLRQRFSDRDFKKTSQAEHLSQLIKLQKETELECGKLKTKYSYSKTIDSKRKANFDSLAGDV